MRAHIDLTPAVNVAYGQDHFYGYFVQVYTNGQHADECECPQCEYDQPAFELDNAGGNRAIIAFVREKVGFDIMGNVVAGDEPVLVDAATYDRAVN